MIPAMLNILFKFRDIDSYKTYRLTYISLLSIIGSPMPDWIQGMVCVGISMKNYVVNIGDIESLAHLNSINSHNLYLVNNRIDVYTRNEIHDRN